MAVLLDGKEEVVIRLFSDCTFCFDNGFCSQSVKGTIVADNEFRYPIIHNMSFYCPHKRWEDLLRRFSVTDKETTFQIITFSDI